jgi:hypothetical protein
MIDKSSKELGDVIFEESVQEAFLKSVYLKTSKTEKIERWEYRILGGLAVASAILFLLEGTDPFGAALIALVILFFASILFINSEVGRLMMTKTTEPIRIYENGFKVYSSPMDMLKGFNGIIYSNEISSVLVRNGVDGRGEWFTKIPLMRQGFAERELMKRGYEEIVFYFNNGNEYHSAAKPQETIRRIISATEI